MLALDDVSMNVRAGTVHALMGENGAGKSTLMKIVAGLLTPDAGRVVLRGRVAMIHQELHLMPSMTVAENIFLGREPLTRFGFIDDRALWRRTSELLGALAIDINPDDRVSDLTIAQRQMIEIARAVSYEAQILIMDEPTSALSEREVAQLFEIVADLKARGSAIIYITHKIDEVFRIADEVTVMRDGRVIGSSPANQLDRDRLITMMVGRELTQLFPKDNVPTDRVRLSVKGLSLDGTFSDVSFDVRAGEILGVAGLVGSKRTELAETIFGLRRATSGEILIDGVSGRDGLARGRDRSRDGVPHGRSQDERAVHAAPRAREHGGRGPRRRVRDERLREAGEAACRMSRDGSRGAREDANPVRTGSAPQRRQPAEGAGRTLAADGAAHPDSRRADARHRRGREGRDPSADLDACGGGRGGDHDLVRDAGDSRHERSRHGDAPGTRRRHSRSIPRRIRSIS